MAVKAHPFSKLLPTVLAMAIAGAPGTGIIQSAHAQSPGLSPGPAPVADVAEQLLDAVVNISTSQKVAGDGEGPGPMPRIPEGSPFEDLFEDFFKNRRDGGGSQKVNSLGSGFVIDPSGIIVTNNHVIENADDIEAVFADGSKLKATLLGTDTKTDLSVLKVEPPKPLRAVKFGDSRKMRIGDWVMAIGNPFGLGGSVTLGIISARGRNINAGPYDNFIQTDAAINKGNSGGPLFNMQGEVIGINTAIISPSGGSIGIGFSVPTELAENIIKQLIEFGETRRGWLGVRIQPVTDEVAKSVGLTAARGAMVSGIIKGGPVEKGPIQIGDVIIGFDGRDVKNSDELVRAVAESAVGKEVEVRILREGKEQTVKVTLGRLEDGERTAADASTPPPAEGESGPMDDDPQANGDDSQAPASSAILGMELAPLDDAARERHGIAASVEGVVITAVEPGSAAAEKGITIGEVIVEVSQEFVQSVDQVSTTIDKLRQDGRRSAHLTIANADGDLRFIAVPLE